MNYIYTLKSYKCDKKCPYCITKILKRNVEEDVHNLESYLSDLTENYHYFILSGNGEPSLYDIDTLSYIKNVAEKSGKFKDFRIQTSGNLFLEKDKYKLFENWLKEVTVISIDQEEDIQFFKYKAPYFDLMDNRIRINITLINQNIHKLEELVECYIGKYETVSLKLLDSSNAFIEKHAIKYEDYILVLNRMKKFGNPVYDNLAKQFKWYYNDKIITMSYGKDPKQDMYIQIER